MPTDSLPETQTESTVDVAPVYSFDDALTAASTAYQASRAEAALDTSTQSAESAPAAAAEGSASPTTADASKSADGSPEDDNAPVSRRRAAEISREAVAAYEAERQRREAAEAALAEKQRADEALVKAVSASLGSDEEYEEAQTRALDGDFEAAEQFKAMKAARRQYADVSRYAQLEVRGNLGRQYEAAKGYEGVDPNALQTAPDLGTALAHVYAAGQRSAEARYKAELARSSAAAKGQAAARVADLSSPELGGRATGGAPAQQSWRDPETGLPTDAASAAFTSGKLRFLPKPRLG